MDNKLITKKQAITKLVWRTIATLPLLTLGLAKFTAPVNAATFNSPEFSDYRYVFQDAVTGDNQFIGNDGKTHWFVNTGADRYNADEYERPTSQTYKNFTAEEILGTDSELQLGKTYYATDANNPAYYQYLDIVSGRYDFDSQYLYFAIELYGDKKVGSDGTEVIDFGESSYYNIRLGETDNANNSLLLSSQNPKDLTDTFQAKETFGYYDRNSDVGGTSITTVNENPGSLDGYEKEVIADGKAKDANSDPELLFSRRNTNGEGKPIVEFAFDYKLYNELFSGTDINPEDGLAYLVFEANRGTKDNANYLWNDKYTIQEAGTPYNDGNGEPQDVYELDTLTVKKPPIAQEIPEPSTAIG